LAAAEKGLIGESILGRVKKKGWIEGVWIFLSLLLPDTNGN